MAEGTYVTGLRETVRALHTIGVQAEDLKQVMGDIAAEAAKVAASHAPEQSGALKASIRGNKAKGKAIVTAGKAKVPYAGAINYGWRARNIKAAGFMAAADREVGPKAEKMLIAGINKIINEQGF